MADDIEQGPEKVRLGERVTESSERHFCICCSGDFTLWGLTTPDAQDKSNVESPTLSIEVILVVLAETSSLLTVVAAFRREAGYFNAGRNGGEVISSFAGSFEADKLRGGKGDTPPSVPLTEVDDGLPVSVSLGVRGVRSFRDSVEGATVVKN